jgi:hypothetical protein
MREHGTVLCKSIGREMGGKIAESIKPPVSSLIKLNQEK